MIFVDVETAGLDPRRSGIISIGAISWVDGEEEGCFYGEGKLRDDAEVSPRALDVNGYRLEYIQGDGSPLAPVDNMVHEFHSWARSMSSDRTLSGWNVQFDSRFLRHEYRRSDLSWPFGFRLVDLHALVYAKMYPDFPVMFGVSAISLNGALEFLGCLPEPDPHRADQGARANLALWRRLRGESVEKEWWFHV